MTMLHETIQLLDSESKKGKDIKHLHSLCRWAQVNLDPIFHFRFKWMALCAKDNRHKEFRTELAIIKDFFDLEAKG